MIPDDNALSLFKFGEYRWISKIIEGNISFSCTGAFINQAKKTGNEVQGDLYEGIFAKLQCGDPRIEKMKKELGTDLEIIYSGKYALLRRKSSKLQPIFCLYAYKAKDALKENDVKKCGNQRLRHDFDDNMYSGFTNSLVGKNVISDTHRFTQIMLQPKPFVNNLKIAFVENNLSANVKTVNNKLFLDEEFWIEPTEKYDELFYKTPKYAYQHECRICIYHKKLQSIFDRYNLKIIPIQKEDYGLVFEPVYMEFDSNIELLL